MGGAEHSLALLLANLPSWIEPSALVFGDGHFAASLRRDGIPVDVVEVPHAVSSVRRERFGIANVMPALSAISRLRQVIGARRPDVVHTNTVKALVLGAVAARTTGTPCVIHARDILTGNARRLVATIGASCSTERIAISRAVEASLGLGRTTVIPNPLDLRSYRNLPAQNGARRELGLPEGVPLVGMVGRINRWKGHATFLDVAIEVARVSDAHFAIVGDAMFRDADFVGELHERIARSGFADRFHMVPWQSDVRVAYAALDVHCNASVREPFGRTTIEAAAAGIPTVCFDDGGAPEAMAGDESGCTVPAGDVAAFAAAVLRYVADADLRARAAIAARRHARTFDASLHAARVADVLRRVGARADVALPRKAEASPPAA